MSVTFFRYFASKEDLALSFIRDSTDAVIDTAPSLLAALLRYMHDRDDELVRVSMLATFDAYAAQLKPALLEHWA
jgi:AcrR family transcriptional regulator